VITKSLLRLRWRCGDVLVAEENAKLPLSVFTGSQIARKPHRNLSLWTAAMQKMKKALYHVLALVALALLAAPLTTVLAQDEEEEDVCCNITVIEAKTGIVTAQHTATGQTFRFSVTDAATLQSLRVGQGVWADFGTGRVRIYGAEACCGIVTAARGGAGLRGVAANVRGEVNPGESCCAITSINVATGIVTARNTATGKTFRFRASTAAARGFRVGQAVYANFAAAGRIGVTPSAPCCEIVP
jgi:hypothetical protein